MAHVYFHCSGAKGTKIERWGAAVEDLAEARDHADRVVRSLTMAHNLVDWRGWVLRASDDLGDELFVLPFVLVLGKPH
jgi:hypothetical protein